jgi:hypothetical protein
LPAATVVRPLGAPRTAVPTNDLVYGGSLATRAHPLAAFRMLLENGYVEGALGDLVYDGLTKSVHPSRISLPYVFSRCTGNTHQCW